MITLEDLRKAEVAVKRQERVVSNRQKRVQEEAATLAILKAGFCERAADYARQQQA